MFSNTKPLVIFLPSTSAAKNANAMIPMSNRNAMTAINVIPQKMIKALNLCSMM